MRIEIGKTYKRGDGRKTKIMGKAVKSASSPLVDAQKEYFDDVYWAADGNWYHEDGAFYWAALNGEKVATRNDLVEEVVGCL